MCQEDPDSGSAWGGQHVKDDIPGDAQRRLVRDAIAVWRDSLVNLSGSNRLLNFRPRKTSAVRIVLPDSSSIVRDLLADATFSFSGPSVDLDKSAATPEEERSTRPTGRGRRRPVPLRTESGGRDLSGALRNLMRRSQQEYLDRGLRILYLAVGALNWTDEAGSEYTSPLLLLPVELLTNGPQQLPDLGAVEEDAVLNPALILKLAESGIELPALKELDDIDPAQVLAQVRAAVAGRRTWRVENMTVLSYFTFAKEAMYRDLLDNQDRIAEHPAIRALAAGGRGAETGDFDFDELRDEDVDERAPADATPLVLDADSSQRACIAAAVDGRSFVMDGPPGTGKSQTIANMIGALLNAGRTVLFVSEKAAALDVVRNRLDHVGLGAYLLELHSSKATRKEVATELGRSLDSKPVAPSRMSAVDVVQLRRRQAELNRYAAAMNEPRAPLNLSLHTVIGRISELADLPTAPATGRPVDGLDPRLFGEIKRQAQDMAAAWRPALEGSTYLWRDIRERRAMTTRLQAALRAVDDLHSTMQANRAVMDAFDLGRPAQAEQLATLLEHQAERPPGVPDHWLTVISSQDLGMAVQRLHHRVEVLRVRQGEASSAAGTLWSDLPSPDGLAALDLRRLDGLRAAPLPVDDMTGPMIDSVLDRLTNDSKALHVLRTALDDVAGLLRLPAPSTFDDADKILFVASTASEPDRPEAAWLSPRGGASAAAALDHFGSVRRALDDAEAAARHYYDDSALLVDAKVLDERFRTRHTGVRKLSGAYRQDKTAVAAFTRDGIAPGDAYQQLASVVAWQEAVAALQAAAPAHARDLGSYYRGRATDVARTGAAIQRAASIVGRFRQDDLHGVAAQIARGASSAPALLHATRTAASTLQSWRNALNQAVDLGPRPQLLNGSLSDAITWIDAHTTVLSMVREVVRRLDGATGRSWTVSATRRVLGLRLAVDRAASDLDADSTDHEATCGQLFQGDRTDLDALRVAAEWAEGARSPTGGVHGPDQLAALAQSSDVRALRPAISEWRARRADVLEAFDPVRRRELTEELDDFDDACRLLSALLEDPAGQDEWTAYRHSRDELVRVGLGEAVKFCMREQMTADQVPDVIEKAVLTEWVDHYVATDEALRAVRAQDRDTAVAEFRELDRRLITTAVGSIIDACNERRPRAVTGQAGVIRREAEKKRKHMPVRDLVHRSREVTQAIKPCFMMSPLAVSQYLPPDLTFDVVIFDEASQVAPMDAINCIYRGRALITAGDRKQLPPTNFFALAGDDGDEWVDDADDAKDFESILDLAKSSGVYRSLTLKWHYRSRHESLISFSNVSFYEGQLITFPGAEHEGPDVGVELVPVQGVYRRGSTRDNPIEAREVAERVLHHYDTRPGRSVGVVTFSEAQATAIEAAVEEARRDRPELDDHFTESRLDGFFVKSLESVQGDERDVMIFSVGYGPDEAGRTTMHFGPLNRSGGWRRLNVAVTRARYRNEIVTSLRAGDITASASNEGLRHLRRYLDFAERGQAALALSVATGGDAESPFEESVISTIRSWGYDVTPQVGAAGYRIDMAVHHPDHPGVFVLAIECDGAQYHSSRVARDRDRLRDQVLVGLGWTMHRIWGTAWYRDRRGAERRLIEAIEAAIRAPVSGVLGGSPVAPALERTTVELESVDYAEVPDWTVPYALAEISGRPRWTDSSDPAVVPAMRTAVEQIVATEGPVHIEVVHQRFRQAWNIGQIGSRIRANIESAVVRSAQVSRIGDFLHVTGVGVHVVRTPVDGCRRTVEQVHGSELEAALVNLVRDAGGIALDDITVHAAKLYGWGRRGPDITRRLDATLESLVSSGRLRRTGDELSVQSPH